MKHIAIILASFIMLCSPSWSETPGVTSVKKDLVERNGLFYRNFSNVPFTGKVSGEINGNFKNGKPDGIWEWYHYNGQLKQIGNYKDGEWDGLWRWYTDQGKASHTDTYKDGKLLE